MVTAEDIIELYGLEPLDQEGGYFRQIWRSPLRVPDAELGAEYSQTGDHPMGTIIHFLLTEDSYSAMHRLPTPEHWFHHLGDAAEMLLLHTDGSHEKLQLGANLGSGQRVHVTTPAQSWQGTRLLPGGAHGYMFGSCVMIPGFEWIDFELGERSELCGQYPQAAEGICLRTRDEIYKGSM